MAKKILLAEDSVTMQKVVEMTFGAEDFTVTAVGSIQDALARAQEMRPDILIADTSMAGHNGYDACAELKKAMRIPVLLLHGALAPLDRDRARQVGADGDLAKPFETQSLIDKVQELVARPPVEMHLEVKPLSSPIESEDVVIDAGAFEAEPPPAPVPAPPLPAVQTKPLAATLPLPAAPQVPASKPATAAPKPLVVAPPKAPAADVPSNKPSPPPSRPSAFAPTQPLPAQRVAAPPVSAPAAVVAPVSMPASPEPEAPEVQAFRPLTVPMPPPDDVRDEGLDVEITIDAEPPPESEESHPSFDTPVAKAPVALPKPPPGMSLPKPPPGMTLPPPPPGMTLPRVTKAAPVVRAVSPAAPAPVAPIAPTPVAPAPVLAAHVAAPVASAVVSAAGAGRTAAIDPAVLEAISKLTREVIEQIVWEIVPDLAEAIIKEELERTIAARKL